MDSLHYEPYAQTHMGPLAYRVRSHQELIKQQSAGTSCTAVAELSLNLSIDGDRAAQDASTQPSALTKPATPDAPATAAANALAKPRFKLNFYSRQQLTLCTPSQPSCGNSVNLPEPPLKIKTGTEIAQELKFLAMINDGSKPKPQPPRPKEPVGF